MLCADWSESRKADLSRHRTNGFYTRYFEENRRTETNNSTIGIVLCTERDSTIVKYSVMNDSNQLFASKYKLYLPTEEELIKELETSRKQIEDNVK